MRSLFTVRRLSGLCLLMLFLLPAAVQSTPIVGDEWVVDTGLRFPYRVRMAETSALAVGDTTVLQVWGDDGSIWGSRRSRRGGEMDPRPVNIGSGRWFGLCGRNSLGWPMVYVPTGDANQLVIANLDPVTLTPVQSSTVVSGSRPIWNPEVAQLGDTLVVVWIEAGGFYSLRMLRLRLDLTPIDDQPIPLDPAVSYVSIDLAAGPTGGLLAYYGASQQATVQLLGADGLPAGDPHALGAGWSFRPIAACSSGEGWLVAWTDASQHLVAAFLDRTGAIQAPRVMDVGGNPGPGLSVAADDAGDAIVCWRGSGESEGTIYSVRAIPGEGIAGPPTPLDTEAPYDPGDVGPIDLRELATSWTGVSFAVLWNSSHWEPCGKKSSRSGPRGGEEATAGGAPRPLYNPYAYPVLSQWIATDGTLLYSSPLYATQEPAPNEIIAGRRTDGGYLAVVDNGSASEYLSAIPLESGGEPAGPWAHRQVTSDHYCDWTRCTSESVGGLLLRPWGDDQAVAMRYSYYYYDWTYGTTINQYSLYVFRLAGDGLGTPWCSFRSPNESQFTSYDLAPGADSTIVFYTTDDGSGGTGTVRLLDRNASVLRTWSVTRSGSLTAVSVVRLTESPARYLLGWQDAGVARLALLDPKTPEGTIVGAPFAPGASAYGTLRFIPGRAQVLCAFAANYGAETGVDVFGVRFDSTGAPLDPAPFTICAGPRNQGNVDGTWLGGAYLVTWYTANVHGVYTPEAGYGNQVSRRGMVLDGEGFYIAETGPSLRCTAGVNGEALLAYRGDRLRRLTEGETPVLLSNLRATCEGRRVLLRWWALEGAFETFTVKRTDGDSSIEAGRVPPGLNESSYEWSESGVAPGWHTYQIEARGRNGSVEILGPVSVNVEEGAQDLSLRWLGSVTDGTIRLRLQGPSSAGVSVQVYDAGGRRIRDLGSTPVVGSEAGLSWDGHDSNGEPAPSGIYWIKATDAGAHASCRVVLVR